MASGGEVNSIVPTAQAGDASNRSASTAFVTAAIAAAIAGISTPVYVPSGSVLLFWQAAAPTGYTQVVTQNDKGLRVVSGVGGGTGGSTAFSTVFAQTATGATTITTATMPSHVHSVTAKANAGGCGAAGFPPGNGVNACLPANYNTNSNGSDGSHTHPISLQLQFIDIIICSKN